MITAIAMRQFLHIAINTCISYSIICDRIDAKLRIDSLGVDICFHLPHLPSCDANAH